MTDFKKTAKLIEDMNAKKARDIATITEVINKAKRDLDTATNVLEVTDDEDEYKKAAEDIAKAKTTITLNNRKLKALDTLITPEDLKDITAVIMTRYHELNTTEGARINNALMDLIKLMETYENEVAELSKLEAKARTLANDKSNYVSPIRSDSLRIDDDPLKWFECFVRFYFRTRFQMMNYKRTGIIKERR